MYVAWDGADWSYTTIFNSSYLTGQLDLELDDDEYAYMVYCMDNGGLKQFRYTYFDENGQHDSYIIGSSFAAACISLDLDAGRTPHVSLFFVFFMNTGIGTANSGTSNRRRDSGISPLTGTADPPSRPVG